MKEYLKLVEDVLAFGNPKDNTRGGVDTVSLFGYHYKTNVSHDYFPLLTTKEMSWKNVLVENLWFLSGNRDVRFLHKHGVHFWDQWVQEDGTIPSPYGYYWRHFPTDVLRVFPDGRDWDTSHFEWVDQVWNALRLLKENRNTRQAVVSAWCPENTYGTERSAGSSLPPCHLAFALNVQEDILGNPYLNLALFQRSGDIALGIPYNLAGYSFLLCLFGRILGLPTEYFSHTIVDAHIYVAEKGNRYDHRVGLTEQMFRAPRPRPRLIIDDRIKTLEDVDELIRSNASTEELLDTFRLVDYDPHPAIRFMVAV